MRLFLIIQLTLLFRKRYYIDFLIQYGLFIIVVYFSVKHLIIQTELLFVLSIFFLCTLDEKYLLNLFSFFDGEYSSLALFPFHTSLYLLGKELIWIAFFNFRIIVLYFLIKPIFILNWYFFVIALPSFFTISILASGLAICIGVNFVSRILFYILIIGSILVTMSLPDKWLIKNTFFLFSIIFNVGALLISRNFLTNCEGIFNEHY